jgi:hypothetical protein
LFNIKLLGTAAMQSQDTKSIPALFGDVVGQFGSLVGSELRLAQAELSQKVIEASRGLAYVVAAGVLMIPAAVMLLLTLAIWLVQMGMSPVLAHLTAGAIGAALSVVLGISGLNRLKLKNLKLTNTTEQMDQDLAAARELAK